MSSQNLSYVDFRLPFKPKGFEELLTFFAGISRIGSHKVSFEVKQLINITVFAVWLLSGWLLQNRNGLREEHLQ